MIGTLCVHYDYPLSKQPVRVLPPTDGDRDSGTAFELDFEKLQEKGCSDLRPTNSHEKNTDFETEA